MNPPMTKPNEPEALEPCPFCHGPARAFQDRTWHRIKCVNCGAEGAASNRPEKTAKMWNRRAPAQPIADAGRVTDADKKLLGHIVAWVHCPTIMSVEQVEQMIAAHRLQSVAAATAAKEAGALPQDVVSLVIAAREAWEAMESDGIAPKRAAALDRALLPFSWRVPYDDEPEGEE